MRSLVTLTAGILAIYFATKLLYSCDVEYWSVDIGTGCSCASYVSDSVAAVEPAGCTTCRAQGTVTFTKTPSSRIRMVIDGSSGAWSALSSWYINRGPGCGESSTVILQADCDGDNVSDCDLYTVNFTCDGC